MAKYDFIFPIAGSLGGLTFYRGQNSEPLVKEKNRSYQPTSAAIKRNNKELGGGSTMCKHFRSTFLRIATEFGEQSTCGRLNGKFKNVITHGVGDWGQRAFDLKNSPEEVLGFHFQKQLSVREVLADALLQPVLNAERDQVRWALPAFVPRTAVSAPAKATHFQLVLVATQVSPGQYSDAQNLYVPVYPMPASSAGVARSAFFELAAAIVGPLVMDVAPGAILPTPEAMRVVTCVGVMFGRLVNGIMVPMKEGRAMDVLGVG